MSDLSDRHIEFRLRRLASAEGRFLAFLLAHLAEFDRRRLAGAFGQPSLFHYCVRVLGFSEGAAYKRIQGARAVRDFPVLLEEVARGRLNLAALVILSPHLRVGNFMKLIETARGKTIRELEAFTASLAPRPDAPDLLRALPAPPIRTTRHAGDDRESGGLSCESDRAPSSPPSSPCSHRPKPISARRYVFKFTGGQALRDKYERARALLMGRPTGAGMESLFEAALDSLLERIDPERKLRRKERRKASTETRRASPARPRGRRVPQAVKDIVWRRDQGRCTFVGPNGKRCPATALLEYDHIVPFALGGESRDPRNIRLACREHNQLQARRIFGAAAIDRAVRRRGESRTRGS